MAIRPIDSKSEFDVRLLTRSESLKKSDERAAATISELADKIKTEGSGTALEMLGNLALHEDQDLALAAMNKLNSLYADTFDMAIQSVIERVNQIRANPWPRDGMAGEPAGGGAASRPAATRAQPDDWGHEKRPIGVSTYTSSASARPDEGSRDSESENRYTPLSRRRASSVYGPLPNQVRHRQPVFSDAAVQVGGGDTGTQSETPADNQATGAGRRESGLSINQTVNVRIKIAGPTGTTTQTHMSQPAEETTAAAGATRTETQPLPQSDVQARSQTDDVADQTESLETRGMTTQGEASSVAQSTAGTQTAVEQSTAGTQTVAAVRVDTDSQTELQQPKAVEIQTELQTDDMAVQVGSHETNEIATQAGMPAVEQNTTETQTNTTVPADNDSQTEPRQTESVEVLPELRTEDVAVQVGSHETNEIATQAGMPAVEQNTTETQTNTTVPADNDSQTEPRQTESVEVLPELRTEDVAVQVGSHETNEIATQAGTPAAALSTAETQTAVEQSTAGTQTAVEQSTAGTQTAVEQKTMGMQTDKPKLTQRQREAALRAKAAQKRITTTLRQKARPIKAGGRAARAKASWIALRAAKKRLKSVLMVMLEEARSRDEPELEEELEAVSEQDAQAFKELSAQFKKSGGAIPSRSAEIQREPYVTPISSEEAPPPDIFSAGAIEGLLKRLPKLKIKDLKGLQPTIRKMEEALEEYKAEIAVEKDMATATVGEEFFTTTRKVEGLHSGYAAYVLRPQDFKPPPNSQPGTALIIGVLAELSKSGEGRDLLKKVISLDDTPNIVISLRGYKVIFSPAGEDKVVSLVVSDSPRQQTKMGEVKAGDLGSLLDAAIGIKYAGTGGSADGADALALARSVFRIGGSWLDVSLGESLMEAVADNVRRGNVVLFRVKDGRLGRVIGVENDKNQQPEKVLVITADSERIKEIGIDDFSSQVESRKAGRGAEEIPALFAMTKGIERMRIPRRVFPRASAQPKDAGTPEKLASVMTTQTDEVPQQAAANVMTTQTDEVPQQVAANVMTTQTDEVPQQAAAKLSSAEPEPLAKPTEVKKAEATNALAAAAAARNDKAWRRNALKNSIPLLASRQRRFLLAHRIAMGVTKQRLGVFLEEVLRMTQIDKQAAEMALKEVFEGVPERAMEEMAKGISAWFPELISILDLEPEGRLWRGLLSVETLEKMLFALPKLNNRALQSLQPIAKKLKRFVEEYRASAGQRSAAVGATKSGQSTVAVGATKSEQSAAAMDFRRTLRKILRLDEENFMVPEYFPSAEDFMPPPGSPPTAVAIGGMLGELTRTQGGRDLLKKIIKIDDDGGNLEMSLRNGTVTFGVGDGKDYEVFMRFQPYGEGKSSTVGIESPGNMGSLLNEVIKQGYASRGGEDLDIIRSVFPLGGFWLVNDVKEGAIQRMVRNVRSGDTVFFRFKDGRLGRVAGIKNGRNRAPEKVLIAPAGSEVVEEIGIKDFLSRLAVRETMLVETKPVETKSGEAKPGEAKPGEAKPGEAKSGEIKPVGIKPVGIKPVGPEPALFVLMRDLSKSPPSPPIGSRV